MLNASVIYMGICVLSKKLAKKEEKENPEKLPNKPNNTYNIYSQEKDTGCKTNAK